MGAYLATTAEIIRMLTMSVGLIYFIVKICSDAWASLMNKPHTKWIPGKALVLSALTLEILTYVNYKSVSISDVADRDQTNVLFGDQLVIDSGRLVICVFIGYLLPAMARPGSAQDWTDIVALVVSVFSAVISELYYIHKTTKYIQEGWALKESTDSESALQKLVDTKAWFIGSSVAILVSTVMLILFLVSAIIAGKTVRGLLTQRIFHVMKPSSEWSWDTHKEDIRSGKYEWNKFKDEMMRSWLLCHVGQPPYVIARSVLSSSTGLTVTACISLVVTKALVLRYFRSFIPPRYDGWDWLRYIVFGLQCVFVLMGWLVICWRWWLAVVCFLSRPKRKGTWKSISELVRCQRYVVEDFWTRSIRELTDVYDLHKWHLSLSGRPSQSCGINVRIVTTFKLYRLSIFCVALQKLLILFSKGCWFVSEMVLILLPVKSVKQIVEFEKHQEALEHMCMPGESAESLWLASAKSFEQAKDCLDYKASSNQANGQSLCPNLKMLFERSFSSQFGSVLNGGEPSSFVDRFQQQNIGEKYNPLIEYFPFLQETNWKMIAVSLLKIMKISFTGTQHSETVIKACYEAWEFMTFVDRSHIKLPDSANPAKIFDIEVDQVSVAADKELKMLRESPRNSTGVEDIRTARDQARRQLEDYLKSVSITQQTTQSQVDTHHKLRDSQDWNVLAPNYYMYRVCKLVLDPPNGNGNGHELRSELENNIADLIYNCMLELPEALVTRSKDWAVKYEEDDIWDALYTAGKAIKFMEEPWWPREQSVQSN